MNTREVEVTFSKRTAFVLLIAACMALLGIMAACVVGIVATAIDIAHESIGFSLVWQVLLITISASIAIIAGFAAISFIENYVKARSKSDQ